MLWLSFSTALLPVVLRTTEGVKVKAGRPVRRFLQKSRGEGVMAWAVTAVGRAEIGLDTGNILKVTSTRCHRVSPSGSAAETTPGAGGES